MKSLKIKYKTPALIEKIHLLTQYFCNMVESCLTFMIIYAVIVLVFILLLSCPSNLVFSFFHTAAVYLLAIEGQ